MPRKADELYGYNMGRAIDEIQMLLNEIKDDYNDILTTYPTNPKEWVRYIGRANKKHDEALKALKYIKDTYDANKTRGNGS